MQAPGANAGNPADHPRPEAKDSNPAAVQQGGQGSKWPWGPYTTKLLEELAAAIQEFWTKYDPARPQTAPTNRKVEEWLKSHGVAAARVREIMAKIIRDDKAPRGPRPRS